MTIEAKSSAYGRIQTADTTLNRIQDAVRNAVEGVRTDSGNAIDVVSALGTYLESVVADAAVTGWTTGVAKNITSLLLPPGTWQVFGDAVFGGGAVTGTDTLFQITTTSAAFQAINGYSQSAFEAPIVPTAGSNVRASLAPRLVVSTAAAPATAFLVGRTTFTAGGPPTAGGALRAWLVKP